ncbi:MAG: hypothetical protein GY937_20110 [bacterium]|nr:hypothetical protein [bacterium]
MEYEGEGTVLETRSLKAARSKATYSDLDLLGHTKITLKETGERIPSREVNMPPPKDTLSLPASGEEVDPRTGEIFGTSSLEDPDFLKIQRERNKELKELSDKAQRIFEAKKVPLTGGDFPYNRVLRPGHLIRDKDGDEASLHKTYISEMERRHLRNLEIMDYIVKHILVEDVDYYVRLKVVEKPGQRPKKVDEKILMKGGAEKIRNVHGLQAKTEVDYGVQSVLEKAGLKGHFPFITTLTNSLGEVVSTGRGVGIADAKRNTNSAVKMGQKSSHIDANLNLGYSSMFAQEPDEGRQRDLDNGPRAAVDPKVSVTLPPETSGGETEPGFKPKEPESETPYEKASSDDAAYIQTFLQFRGFTGKEGEKKALERHGVERAEDLPKETAEKMVKAIKSEVQKVSEGGEK